MLKLSVGLATHSLGLVSEAAHSGTDLVAALLTFFAIRVAARPADVTHQFGHGKAEHLAALAEAAFLVLVSLFISVARDRAADRSDRHASCTPRGTRSCRVRRDRDRREPRRRLVADVAPLPERRARVERAALRQRPRRLGRRARRTAPRAAGHPNGDPIAALFVGVLVLLAAARLMKVNIDVLMDRAPAEAEAAALLAIGRSGPRSSCAGCACARRVASSSPTS